MNNSGRGRYWRKVRASVVKPRGISHKHLDGLLNIKSHSSPRAPKVAKKSIPPPRHKHMMAKKGASDRDMTNSVAVRRDSLVAKEFRRESIGEPKRKNSRSNSIGEDDTVHIRKGRRQTMLLELRKFYDHRDDEDKQGDADESDNFYTDKALLQRESLRFDTKLAGILNKLYDLVDSDGGGQISEQEYYVLNRKLYLVLKAFWDPDLPTLSLEETNGIASQDWNLDRDGHDCLNKQRFALSMFQLCDVWTEEIDKEEYCKFLDGIYERISTVSHPSGKRVFKTEDQLTNQMQIQMTKHARKKYEDGTGDDDPLLDEDDDTLHQILALDTDEDGLWHITPEIMALCGKSLEDMMHMDRIQSNQFLIKIITTQYKDRKSEWRMPVGRVRKALKKLQDAQRKASRNDATAGGRRRSRLEGATATKKDYRRKTEVPRSRSNENQSRPDFNRDADDTANKILKAGRHTTENHKKAKDFRHGQNGFQDEYMDGTMKSKRDDRGAGAWRSGHGHKESYIAGLGGGVDKEELHGRYLVDQARRPQLKVNALGETNGYFSPTSKKRRPSLTHGKHAARSPRRRSTKGARSNPSQNPSLNLSRNSSTEMQQLAHPPATVAQHQSPKQTIDEEHSQVDSFTVPENSPLPKDINNQHENSSEQQGNIESVVVAGAYANSLPTQASGGEALTETSIQPAREEAPQRGTLQPYEITPWLYASKLRKGRLNPGRNERVPSPKKLPVVEDLEHKQKHFDLTENFVPVDESNEREEQEQRESFELPPMDSVMSSASMMLPPVAPAPPGMEAAPSTSGASVFSLYAKLGEKRFELTKSPEKPTTFSAAARPLKLRNFSVARLLDNDNDNENEACTHVRIHRSGPGFQIPHAEKKPFYWRTAAPSGGHLTKSNIRQINWQPHYENERASYDDDLVEKRSIIHYGSKGGAFALAMATSQTAR